MNVKRNLILWTAVLALALPLFMTGIANAVVFNSDGAVHNPTDASGTGWGLNLYCVGAPAIYDGSTQPAPAAAKRLDLPNNFAGCTVPAQVTTGVNTTNTNKASCEAAGYFWDSYNAPGTQCVAAFISTDANASGTAWYTGENGCFRCHSTGQMAAVFGGSKYAKESSLGGGHKNMSRPVDGLKWTMPGVTLSTPFLGDAVQAGLGPDGSFLNLWIQEDYPRMLVDWNLKTVSVGYCGTALNVTGTGDVPDLAACPTCESPVMGNGAAGYPLGYPNQATCEAAKKPGTGATGYVWTPTASAPLYWIYGGAGLEGGPAMMEPGTQQYKCGRCHTTGWSANNATDAAIVGKTKLPYNNPDWSSVDFTTLKAVGSTSSLLLGPAITGYALSSWDQFGIECSRCHIATDSGHATWPTASTKGGDIIAACMTCHRQEGDPNPRANSKQNGYLANSNAATPFTNKAQQPDGFAHHPDGPEFLNSPHSKMTGTWGQIGCPPYAISGYSTVSAGTPTAPTDCTPGAMNLDGSTSSLYASKFAQASKVDLTVVSDSAAGSCVVCHDVHKPLNNNVAGMNAGSTLACTACHTNPSATVSPQVNLSILNHPTGIGTPLDDPNPCSVCHQPAGIKHIWRINTDPNYTTYGNYGIGTDSDPVNGGTMAVSQVNLSNTAADGAYTNAVWIDVDIACGQCHGGGVSQTNLWTSTTATITGAVTSVTVADATGFASGKRVKIAGAGVAGADFETIIASVSGNTVKLTYATPVVASAAAGAVVTVDGNPAWGGAPYKTKATLAAQARNMHQTNPVAHFVATAGTGTSYQMNFSSIGSTCPGGATCTYAWDLGDSTLATGATTSHVYTAGTYTVTLIVSAGSPINTDSLPYSKLVTPTAIHTRPTAAHTGTTLNLWTVSFTDASASTTQGVSLPTGAIKVNWGDGSVSLPGNAGDVFTHDYSTGPRGAKATTYRILHTVNDGTLGSVETFTVAVPQKFTVSGVVSSSTGSNIASVATPVYVYLRLNGHTRAYRKSTTDGSFSFGGVLPGNYTLKAYRLNASFGTVETPVVVDQDRTGIAIHSITP